MRKGKFLMFLGFDYVVSLYKALRFIKWGTGILVLKFGFWSDPYNPKKVG